MDIVAPRGVLLIATGDRYRAAACRTAESVRRVSPMLPIALQTDQPADAPPGLFDQVTAIPDGHARSKVDCLARSPFERTLYLDTDVRVLEDVSELFNLLDRFDVALAHAHARNRKQTRQCWRLELPDCFPQFNTGVMLLRRNAAVLQLLEQWSAAYREAGFRKDQVTLRELLWRSELQLYVLPPEYNLRYLRYAYVWAETEARPRILHLRRYHDQGAPRGQVRRDRLKEAGDDLRAAFRALGGAAKQALFPGDHERS
jgi:hypothetical protein